MYVVKPLGMQRTPQLARGGESHGAPHPAAIKVADVLLQAGRWILVDWADGCRVIGVVDHCIGEAASLLDA